VNDSEFSELSAKLRTWKVEARVRDSFGRAVWQRIAARQAAREDTFGARLGRWLSTQFLHPSYAAATFVVFLLLSVGLAHMQAQKTNARLWKSLEARYEASIDPLAMTAH
jgi:hypothetical protein